MIQETEEVFIIRKRELSRRDCSKIRNAEFHSQQCLKDQSHVATAIRNAVARDGKENTIANLQSSLTYEGEWLKVNRRYLTSREAALCDAVIHCHRAALHFAQEL